MQFSETVSKPKTNYIKKGKLMKASVFVTHLDKYIYFISILTKIQVIDCNKTEGGKKAFKCYYNYELYISAPPH